MYNLTSYSGGPRFKYWPGNQLYWLKISLAFLNLIQIKCQQYTMTAVFYAVVIHNY